MGHMDMLLSGHEPFLPTPIVRRDKLQAQINTDYIVLGSQQQGNKLRAPAYMADKLFTNWDKCRKIFCPWQHACTVSSVTQGVSYAPGVSPWELWRLCITLHAPPWDGKLCKAHHKQQHSSLNMCDCLLSQQMQDRRAPYGVSEVRAWNYTTSQGGDVDNKDPAVNKYLRVQVSE